MGRFTERIKGLFRRRKPVSPAEAEQLSTWVNEGGAFDPEGPPPVAEPAEGEERDEQ